MNSWKTPTVLAFVTAVALALAAPAAASGEYGAIALNIDSGQTGVVAGFPTKVKAQKKAQNECPGHCRNALWVRNRCGAIAQNSRGRYFAGFGDRRHDAIKKAKQKARRGPGGPKLIAWVCS